MNNNQSKQKYLKRNSVKHANAQHSYGQYWLWLWWESVGAGGKNHLATTINYDKDFYSSP